MASTYDDKVAEIKTDIKEFVRAYAGLIQGTDLQIYSDSLHTIESARGLFKYLGGLARVLANREAELDIDSIKAKLKSLRHIDRMDQEKSNIYIVPEEVSKVKPPSLEMTEDYRKVREFIKKSTVKGIDRGEVISLYKDLMHSYRR